MHILNGNDTRNTPIVTYFSNNEKFLRRSQKRILIYCLEKRKQSIIEDRSAVDSEDNKKSSYLITEKYGVSFPEI